MLVLTEKDDLAYEILDTIMQEKIKEFIPNYHNQKEFRKYVEKIVLDVCSKYPSRDQKTWTDIRFNPDESGEYLVTVNVELINQNNAIVPAVGIAKYNEINGLWSWRDNISPNMRILEVLAWQKVTQYIPSSQTEQLNKDIPDINIEL